VEADHAIEVRAVAGKLQHGDATEAEADRSQPRGIHLRMVGKLLEAGAQTVAETARVCTHLADDGQRLSQRLGLESVAEKIDGKPDIAEFGQPTCPLLRLFAQAPQIVDHQNARPLAGLSRQRQHMRRNSAPRGCSRNLRFAWHMLLSWN
jgi:hypothetical protein